MVIGRAGGIGQTVLQAVVQGRATDIAIAITQHQLTTARTALDQIRNLETAIPDLVQVIREVQ